MEEKVKKQIVQKITLGMTALLLLATGAGAQDAPQLAIEPEGSTNMLIRWNATAGEVYQLEYSTNLVADGWANLAADVEADPTGTNEIADPLGAAPRFYRVLAEANNHPFFSHQIMLNGKVYERIPSAHEGFFYNDVDKISVVWERPPGYEATIYYGEYLMEGALSLVTVEAAALDEVINILNERIGTARYPRWGASPYSTDDMTFSGRTFSRRDSTRWRYNKNLDLNVNFLWSGSLLPLGYEMRSGENVGAENPTLAAASFDSAAMAVFEAERFIQGLADQPRSRATIEVRVGSAYHYFTKPGSTDTWYNLPLGMTLKWEPQTGGMGKHVVTFDTNNGILPGWAERKGATVAENDFLREGITYLEEMLNTIGNPWANQGKPNSIIISGEAYTRRISSFSGSTDYLQRYYGAETDLTIDFTATGGRHHNARVYLGNAVNNEMFYIGGEFANNAAGTVGLLERLDGLLSLGTYSFLSKVTSAGPGNHFTGQFFVVEGIIRIPAGSHLIISRFPTAFRVIVIQHIHGNQTTQIRVSENVANAVPSDGKKVFIAQ